MPLASPAEYRFDRFILVPAERRLMEGDRPVRLGGRAFDTLLVLVEERERVVTKAELLERVWPHLVVEENNLQVQISNLRGVLGAEAIATLPGVGYRFALPVASSGDVASGGPHDNLPHPLTSFVGHDEDLQEYAALLTRARLFTLTGIGGCGKTRLAIELAARTLRSFPQGVRYFDLAPLLDAERVPLTIAAGLDVHEEPDRPIVESLCERLAGRRMLLVLDNCEHLTAACAGLVQKVLCEAPSVHVLAASREGLGVAGERAVTVRSLSFPAKDAAGEVSAVFACEAVRLFVERAQLSAPGFALTGETAGAVAEICRRLDGIPLAIELAAARLKLLSVDEIRGRLGDRFRLLTGGSKTALPRQQTLLATIRWSYDHLAPDEQRLLRRLSVFVGGWTLEGAVAIADDAQDEYGVLALLERLVDQSLVGTRRVDGGSTRYTMLETVRQYAQERLDETGEGEATRHRALDFCIGLAQQAERGFFGAHERAWFARLDHELENLLAAHAWCDRDGLAERGLQLVASLHMYFRERLFAALGRRVTLEALARPGAAGRDLARCRALWAAGDLSYYTGRYEEARSSLEASLAVARELRNEDRIADALWVLGYVCLGLGDHSAAGAHLQDAVDLSRRLGNRLRISRALNCLAELHRIRGDLQRAKALYEEASLFREHEDRSGHAIHLSNLGMTCIVLGEGERARELLREGLAITSEQGVRRPGMLQLLCAAGLAAHLGEYERAAELDAFVRKSAQQMDFRLDPPDEAFIGPLLACAREALGSVRFAEAASAGRNLAYDAAIAQTRAWLDGLGARSG